MPLLARLGDQFPRIANHHGISEQRPDAAFKDEAIFVLTVVSVHGSRQGARLHRMFDERKTFASAFSFDEIGRWYLLELRGGHHSGRLLLVLPWCPSFNPIVPPQISLKRIAVISASRSIKLR